MTLEVTADQEDGPPLAGITVLDLGQIYNAPYATLLLALHGADVIKVEPPTGEMLRNRDLVKDSGAGIPFYMLNANKRSVTLDLKKEQGHELLLELVDHSDVVVANFRPGVMDRLGLSAATLRTRNAKLIYATSSGFGTDSTHSDVAAMDLNVQAMSGALHSTGFLGGDPVKCGPAIADFFAGIHLYGAIVTALVRRALHGVGSTVDVAMVEAVYPSLMSNVGMVLGSSRAPAPRTGNRHGGLAVCPYNVYRTSDGYVTIVAPTEDSWTTLTGVMKLDELADLDQYRTMAQRVARMDEVDELIASWTSARSTADTFETLRAAGVGCAPVRSLAEVVHDPELRRRGMLQDMEIPGVGVLPMVHSPLRFEDEPRVPIKLTARLGEHNSEIYQGLLGRSADDVRRLKANGVI